MSLEILILTADVPAPLDWMTPADVRKLTREPSTLETAEATEPDELATGTTSGVEWIPVAVAASRTNEKRLVLSPEDALAIDQLLGTTQTSGGGTRDLDALRSALSWPIERLDLLVALARPSANVRGYVKELPNGRALSIAARLLRMAGPLGCYPSRAVAMGDGGVGLVWRHGAKFVEISAENDGELLANWGESGGPSQDREINLDIADLESVLGFLPRDQAPG